MKSSTKNIAVAALVWLSLASRSIDAFTRPAALNIVAHRKEQVTSNLSASTSLFGLFKDNHHDAPPEDDGGPLPTKEEQDKITKVRRNVLLPHFRTPIISRIVSRVKSRVEEKNIVLFGILDFIRKGTALQGIVEINQGDIPFTDKTVEVSNKSEVNIFMNILLYITYNRTSFITLISLVRYFDGTPSVCGLKFKSRTSQQLPKL
jgi:hypothetical protein